MGLEKAGRDWGRLVGIGEGWEGLGKADDACRATVRDGGRLRGIGKDTLGLGKAGRDWARPMMLVVPLGGIGEGR